MKRINWVIGTNKIAGNTVDDGILHYNEPFAIYLDGLILQPNTDYTYTPDLTSVEGRLDFTNIGGLSNTQKLTLFFTCELYTS
jgi:hypothetical protein